MRGFMAAGALLAAGILTADVPDSTLHVERVIPQSQTDQAKIEFTPHVDLLAVGTSEGTNLNSCRIAMPAGQKATVYGSQNARIMWAITATGAIIGDRAGAQAQADAYAAEGTVWNKYLALARTLAQDSPTFVEQLARALQAEPELDTTRNVTAAEGARADAVHALRGILGYYEGYARLTQKTPREWVLWYLERATATENACVKAVRP